MVERAYLLRTCCYIGCIDNGIGIPAENLTKIFDCFNHFSDPKQNTEGTGIGLSFSKGMAELHHGTIEVESKVSSDSERGFTCFTVKLPLGLRPS
jgi:signal transduction histidine kinase